MAEGYGLQLTGDILKQQLNTDFFRNVYSSADLAKQQEESSLLYDYSKDIGQAYAASLQQQQDIMSSNVGQGYKAGLLEESNLALEEAYNQYLKNYQSDISNIESNYQKTLESIDTARTYQAENAKQFYNLPYQYLQYLYDDENMRNEVFNREAYMKFLDEKGNLKDESVFKTMIFDVNTGEMTDEGREIYKLIMQDQSLPKDLVPTFENWMGTNQEELYDWLYSANPYSSNVQQNIDTLYNLLEFNRYDKVGSYDLPEQNVASIKNILINPDGEFKVSEDDYNNAVSNDEMISNYKKGNYFLNTDNKLFVDQGTGKGEQDAYVEHIQKAADEGKFANGTVVNFNYGKGKAANYVYYEGKWYKTSKTATVTDDNLLKDYFPEEYKKSNNKTVYKGIEISNKTKYNTETQKDETKSYKISRFIV